MKKKQKKKTIEVENKKYYVLNLPGRPKALLDKTVAEIYGEETKALEFF